MAVKIFDILPIPLSPDSLLATGAMNFPLILYDVSDDGTKIAICRKCSYLFVYYNSVLLVYHDAVLHTMTVH